jgi:hypothetical protein
VSIAESKREKIGSIFNGNLFVIPSYQRKYSWTNKERKELWNDIKEAKENNINHFFGTLIFKRVEDENSLSEIYEIIDGQQRTTTLFILLNELIRKLSEGDRKEDLIEAFLYKRKKLKLSPLGMDKDFLENLIFEDDVNELEIKKRSQKNLYSAKKFFSNILSQYNEDEIYDLITFIKNNIEVLVLVVEKQSEAIRMFEIINDRGLDLSYLDKIKSILMLYSTMYLNDKLNTDINDKFEIIFDSNDEIMIKKEELKILNRFDEKETLFIHHYVKAKEHLPNSWNYRNGAKVIFESIKSRCEELKSDKDNLEKFILNYTSDFSNFSKSYAQLIDTIDKKQKYIEAFQFLDFSATLYPLIVILFQQNKLDDLLERLISIEVRVYKLKGTNPRADIPTLCNRLSTENMTISDIKDWLVWFRDKFMNDGNFKYDLDRDIYGNKAIKYILFKYNNSFNSQKIINMVSIYNSLQIEHIFPHGGEQDVKFDVTSFGFEDMSNYDYIKDELGNLLLLEKSLNAGKDVSDLIPSQKVHGYLKSDIWETLQMAGDIDKNGFDKNKIEERTKKIIDFCLKEF